jgi:hypothetical protein
MVFFALAILISSTTYAYVERSTGCGTDPVPSGDCDPGQVLSVFLRTSLGSEVHLGIDGGLTISSKEEIATSLRSELDALECGWDRQAFGPLNEAMLAVLADLVGICNSAHLSAYCTSDTSTAPVLVLERAPCVSENRASASCVVPGAGERSYLVVLVLAPALLPELG